MSETKTTNSHEVNWNVVEFFALSLGPALLGFIVNMVFKDQISWIPAGLTITIPMALGLLFGFFHKLAEEKFVHMLLYFLVSTGMWAWTSFILTPAKWELWLRLLPGTVIAIILVIVGILIIRALGLIKEEQQIDAHLQNGKVTQIVRSKLEDGKAHVTSSSTKSKTQANLGGMQITYEEFADDLRQWLKEKGMLGIQGVLTELREHVREGLMDAAEAKAYARQLMEQAGLKFAPPEKKEEEKAEKKGRRTAPTGHEALAPHHLRERKRR